MKSYLFPLIFSQIVTEKVSYKTEPIGLIFVSNFTKFVYFYFPFYFVARFNIKMQTIS